MLLQQFLRFFLALSQRVCQFADTFCEDGVQFLLGDTQKRIIAIGERYVIGLVEAAEHADLRELGNTCEHHEAQVVVGSLEDGEEALEQFPVAGQLLLLVRVTCLNQIE